MSKPMFSLGAVIAILISAGTLYSQPAPGKGGPQGPRVVSPEILSDKKVTFRLLASQRLIERAIAPPSVNPVQWPATARTSTD